MLPHVADRTSQEPGPGYPPVMKWPNANGNGSPAGEEPTLPLAGTGPSYGYHYGSAGPAAYPDEEPLARTREDLTVRQRRPRRRHVLRSLLILLVVLAGLLTAADRIGVHYADSRLASAIQQEQKLAAPPTVDIEGFPFLTQVARRDFSHIQVVFQNLDTDGLVIQNLKADLYNVAVDPTFNGGTAGLLVATAQITYPDLSAAVNAQIKIGSVQVTPDGAGGLEAAYYLGPVKVASASVTVQVAGPQSLRLVFGTVRTGIASVAVLPAGTSYVVPLQGIPFGLKLLPPVFGSKDVSITTSGQNVPLTNTTPSGNQGL